MYSKLASLDGSNQPVRIPVPHSNPARQITSAPIINTYDQNSASAIGLEGR